MNKVNFFIVIDWLVTPMMEIGAEIGLRKAAEGEKVYILIIDDYIKSEGYNNRLPNVLSRYDIPKKIEKIIVSKDYKNLKVLRKKTSKNIEKKFWPKQIISAYNQIKKNEIEPINITLKNLYLNNINIGEGILSSIISITKNKYPTFSNDKKTIKEVFNLFTRRYKIYEDFFKEDLEIENLVLFNGRFASSKAIESGIYKYKSYVNLLYYERSHCLERYTLQSYMTHNREKVFQEINQFWDECDNHNEASKIAKTFFNTKISGISPDWFSFSKGIQEIEKTFTSKELEKYIQKGESKIISYFTSSEDEFESLGDIWIDKRFKLSQKEIIKEISRIAIKKNKIFVIRVHPNLINASKETKSSWYEFFDELPIKNTLIIRENDKLSSYKVINNSELVVVYGSTIGIESLFLEKPVIVAGSSFYFGTKAKIFTAFNLEDLEKYINDISINYKNNKKKKKSIKESSYPYGYWAYTHGLKYKYYSPITPIRGYLINNDLQKLHRFLSKFKFLFKRLVFLKQVF